MLKSKNQNFTDTQMVQIRKEFMRISRKYIDIFNRLWETNDWLKRFKYKNRNERSVNRSPVRNVVSTRSPKGFNPVFEQSKNIKNSERSNSPSAIDYRQLSPKILRENIKIDTIAEAVNKLSGTYEASRKFRN